MIDRPTMFKFFNPAKWFSGKEKAENSFLQSVEHENFSVGENLTIEKIDNSEKKKSDRDKVIEPPITLLFGYIETRNKKDAIQFIKNQMLKLCGNMDESGYTMLPYLDGFAYELHEGGSRLSVLQWVLDALPDMATGDKLYFKTVSRVVAVEKMAKSFTTLLLAERQSQLKLDFAAPVYKGKLQAYEIDKQKYVNALMIGFFLIFLVLNGVIFVKVKLWQLSSTKQELTRLAKAKDLPIYHFPSDQLPAGIVIDQLVYKDGKWSKITKKYEFQPDLTPVETPAPVGAPQSQSSLEGAAVVGDVSTSEQFGDELKSSSTVISSDPASPNPQNSQSIVNPESNIPRSLAEVNQLKRKRLNQAIVTKNGQL